MVSRVISVIVLLAFLNYLFGCTKTVNVFKEELSNPTEKIVDVIMLDGGVIKFDRKGGRYRTKPAAIVGKTVEGTYSVIPVAAISEFRASKPLTIPLEQAKGQRLVEVILSNQTLVKFDDDGGYYDEKAGVIIGKDAGGKSFKKRAKEIHEIRISKPETMSRAEVLSQKPQHLAEIVAAAATQQLVTTFDANGGKFEESKRSIIGVTAEGNKVELDVDRILYARVKKVDPVLSIVATLGVIAGIFGIAIVIAIATKESCPFVYSYDGENYTFDAEPYGGAICPGLKKTDYSRLEHLKPVAGKYRLLVRNEVEETQYTDEMKLLIVGTRRSTKVDPSYSNCFNSLSARSCMC